MEIEIKHKINTDIDFNDVLKILWFVGKTSLYERQEIIDDREKAREVGEAFERVNRALEKVRYDYRESFEWKE